jgi:hypothetical protein
MRLRYTKVAPIYALQTIAITVPPTIGVIAVGVIAVGAAIPPTIGVTAVGAITAPNTATTLTRVAIVPPVGTIIVTISVTDGHSAENTRMAV